MSRPMHLDDDRIQRLVHRELTTGAERSAREHLAACPDCRRLVSDAERDDADVRLLLRRLDHPAPAVAAQVIVDRAMQRPDALESRSDEPRLRWAAGFI